MSEEIFIRLKRKRPLQDIKNVQRFIAGFTLVESQLNG